VIWLNEFTLYDLDSLLRGNKEHPGWLTEYEALRHQPSSTDFTRWQAAIDRIGGQLWDKVITHIHARLVELGIAQPQKTEVDKVSPIVFMPSGGLQLLPVHAAWRIENGRKRYFLDDCEIRYVPSGYALDAASRRVAAREGKSALVAAVSEPQSKYRRWSPLKYSTSEAEAIAALFGVKALIDQAATHYACIVEKPRTENAGGSNDYIHSQSIRGIWHKSRDSWNSTLRVPISYSP
jgi:hypothetical protein